MTVNPIVINAPEYFSFLRPTEISNIKRIGSPNDGGYVVPLASILEADGLLSLGISNNWTFEKEFNELNPAASIHAYDHTISSGEFLLSFLKSIVKLVLARNSLAKVKYDLKTLFNYPNFFDGNVAQHFREAIGSRSKGDFTDLKTAISRLGKEKLFIKSDIEGSEYETIEDMLEFQSKIVCLTIEFHDLETRRDEFIKAIRRLQNFLTIVHVHGNNCGSLTSDGFPNVIELTMVRSDMFLQNQASLTNSTSEFDAPNNPHERDYQINWGV